GGALVPPCDAAPVPVLDPLSLHDALPILSDPCRIVAGDVLRRCDLLVETGAFERGPVACHRHATGRYEHSAACDELGVRCGIHRSEEHTSELQSRENLVCRLLLEKKKHLQ